MELQANAHSQSTSLGTHGHGNHELALKDMLRGKQTMCGDWNVFKQPAGVKVHCHPGTQAVSYVPSASNFTRTNIPAFLLQCYSCQEPGVELLQGKACRHRGESLSRKADVFLWIKIEVAETGPLWFGLKFSGWSDK